MGLSVSTLALAKKYTDEQIDNVSSSIPPDWNQNDETAPDYIKNRPFYEGEAIKETIFDNTYTNLLGQTYIQDTNKPLNIKIGSLYTVYINGQSYITECYYGKEMGLEVFCLGDKNFEQAPFYLIYTALIGLFNCKFKNPLEVDKVNIKIEEVKPNIITLDRKFIQGNAGENVAGKTYIVDDVEYVANLGAEIFNDYDRNIAIGQYAHAEGNNTIAMDIGSHAEGTNTTAQGLHSHAEGYNTTASGMTSHAEGSNTVANGYNSHAEGSGTIATNHQHAQGSYNIEDEVSLHIVGNGNSLNARSNAHTLDWDGNGWYAGDVYVGSTSGTNKDEGSKKLATEDKIVGVKTEGTKVTFEDKEYTCAAGAEVFNNLETNLAIGADSHAEGNNAVAIGLYSHAEGWKTVAKGNFSHAEGGMTRAESYGHAEGYGTSATGMYSHSEGNGTKALADGSHAEGQGTISSTQFAHTQGIYNIKDDHVGKPVYATLTNANLMTTTFTADETISIYEKIELNILTGELTGETKEIQAKDLQSGDQIKSTAANEVLYVYIINQSNENEIICSYLKGVSMPIYTLGKYAHIVGNGGSNDARSNAHTLDWDGNAWFAGDVYVGSTSGINCDEGSKKLVTESDLNNRVTPTALMLADINTGIQYKIQVVDGKLAMTEATV